MREFLLDANILVRFLAGDDPLQSPIARRIFEQAEAGEIALFVDAVVVAECVYVLTGVGFKRKRAEVAAVIGEVLRNPGVVTKDHALVMDALSRFGSKSVDFQDAWLSACAAVMARKIISFDADLDKFADITRVEPRSI